MRIRNVSELRYSNCNRFKKFIENLREHYLTVGIHRKDNKKYADSDETTAQIGFWNEFGTYNIPPTLILRYITLNNKEKEAFCKFVAKCFKENTDYKKFLKEVGNYLKNRTQERIVNGELPPNAPLTVSGGWTKNKKSGKPFYVEGKGHSIRMYDTGQFVNSVDYEVH